MRALFDDIKVTCLSLRANLLKNVKNLRLVPQLYHVRLYCTCFDSVYLLARSYTVSLQVLHFQIVLMQPYLVPYLL